MIYHDDLRRSENKFQENREVLKFLTKARPKDLDSRFHTLHDAVFSEIDCLECANCCKTTSPIFIQSDIDRMAKTLKMKSGEFIVQYLEMDEDGDFVLKSAPCPFLGIDNKCIVYKDRPRA
ncbi:MAG: YkgJ family cysteine cluster protein, partial [Cyclobacteriaceae bacterium]